MTGPALTLDPVADPRWRALVDAAPDASIFHHPVWLELLRRQYGYEIAALVVPDDGGPLAAGLPLATIRSRLTGQRQVALPFSDVCPPLVAPDASHATGALTSALAQLPGRTGLALEVRFPLEHLPAARHLGGHVVHLLEIPPVEEAERGSFARSAARRGANKARREGVQVARRTDREGLAIFYRLHLATRRRQGVPIQPRRFILRFGELFVRGMGFVSVASRQGEPLAAAVFLHFKRTLTYKYGASDHRHLELRPNNLLFMDAVRWAASNGMATLDFGRTEESNQGLRSFKSLWGAEERPLVYTRLGGDGHDRGPEDDGRVMRMAGEVIRRGPPWVGRAAGETLYGHFG